MWLLSNDSAKNWREILDFFLVSFSAKEGAIRVNSTKHTGKRHSAVMISYDTCYTKPVSAPKIHVIGSIHSCDHCVIYTRAQLWQKKKTSFLMRKVTIPSLTATRQQVLLCVMTSRWRWWNFSAKLHCHVSQTSYFLTAITRDKRVVGKLSTTRKICVSTPFN